MKVTYDPIKREITLAERGLDFEDAAEFSVVIRWISLTIAGTTANCASSRSAISVDA